MTETPIGGELPELRIRKREKVRKYPRGKTYQCVWCGERCESKHFDGAFDKDTGKPVCPGCEATL